MKMTNCLGMLAALFVTLSAFAQEPAAKPGPNNLSPEELISRIDAGSNADNLKYRYLMKLGRRGIDRNVVIALVRQASENEQDANRKLLLDGVLAYGLAHSKDDTEIGEGGRIYVSLLRERTWPESLQKQRERTRADFIRTPEAIENMVEARNLMVEMFKSYLTDGGNPSEGQAYGIIMQRASTCASDMNRTIEELSKQLEKDGGFWIRLGEVQLSATEHDKAEATFQKAWALELKEDAELKRAGHGLVSSRERERKLAKAIEAEQALIDKLKVKDDYLLLASLCQRAGNKEGAKKAIEAQLAAFPTNQTRIEAARIYLDAKLSEDATRVLAPIMPDMTAAHDPADEPYILAAAVLRIRMQKESENPPDPALMKLLTENMPRFQTLSRKEAWLQPYYRQAVVYLRPTPGPRQMP